MHPRAEQFRDAATDRYGIELDVIEFPEGTKTAADAAAAVGCETAQIASSIVVSVDGDLAVVVTSGANRVDLDAVADRMGSPERTAEMADPDRIRSVIGWSIGGVPPICHDTDVPVFFDRTLRSYETVYAAAGTPSAVFPIDPDRLLAIAGAKDAAIAEQ